jgi:MFS family permease
MPVAVTSRYRWVILGLLTVIGTFVAALPSSCMPPLFKEISADLNLSLVDIGWVWGFTSVAGILVSIPGGLLSDRMNSRWFIGISCILVGITGASRGLADSYATLLLTVFLNGLVRLTLPVAVVKIIGIWFKGKNLGLAQGIGAFGMGFGLMLGPWISSAYLSPWLNGWRNVMYVYGIIAVAFGLLWLWLAREPARTASPGDTAERIPIRSAIMRVLRNKYVWFLAFTLFFRVTCLMSMTGYIPTYLKDLGWAGSSADWTLSAFYAASILVVIPVSLFSDRIGARKPVLLVGIVISFIAVGLIPFVSGPGVWAMMILSGFLMDGFMAIFTAQLLETEGVGPALSGTAIGVVFTLAQFGNAIFPPIGNSLAAFGAQWPFIFWAILGALALIPFMMVKETGKKIRFRETRTIR